MNNTPKLFNKIAIIDSSYFLHRALKQPELWQLRSDKTGERTGGIYGFLRILSSELKHMDYYPISVWDAGLADRRTKLYPNYKRNLDKIIENVANKVALENLPIEEVVKDYEHKLSKFSTFSDSVEEIRRKVNEMMASESFQAPEEVAPDDDYLYQYRRQREILINILEGFGIPNIKIGGWEGDDLMVILSRISNESVVFTDDNDLRQLVSETVSVYRPMAKEWFRLSDIELPCTPRDYVIQKAIVGDGSDNIPSVTHSEERKYSLGATRAWGVARLIIESGENPEVYLKKLEETGKNYYKGFIKCHDNYLRNMGLVDLSLVENDPEVISNIESAVLSTVGKGNLFKVLGHLGDHGISSIDTQGILSRLALLSASVLIRR